ncbi:MAG TPA: hypothetical protein VN282_08320 [Pyrinomonadaceae bacterium]|nr:hypothetical protein [Pyrinomonadaceae bacterium]
MAEALKCAGCGGVMEEGFVLDRGSYDFPAEQKWVEGVPQRSFWMGLDIDDKRVYKVMSYRCERCGRLESYARESTS